MPDINHNVVIRTTPGNIYTAITTTEGLSNWFAKATVAKPEIGYVNVFVFGPYRNEMKITELVLDKKIAWHCINSVRDWIDTKISFELEEKAEKTLLRFTHSGWKEMNDSFAGCCYDWATFLRSLKLYCETGTGSPA